MATSWSEPPSSGELEVSLFGPGYGEAMAIHIGAGKWILVDSCVHPEFGLPCSLDYLLALGVDVENAVDLIVVTHWHDDHIAGISTILDYCTSAILSISIALRLKEFLQLVALYGTASVVKNSGIEELVKVFEILEDRKSHGVRFNPPKLAHANTRVFREEVSVSGERVETTVCALSPSDAAVLKAQLAFSQLLESTDQRNRIGSPSANEISVVLQVQVGHDAILLGSDLQTTSDPTTGWSVIVDESTVVSQKATVFKIPHHGSENAHHGSVWSELLISAPYAILSPFRRGNVFLPAPSDITRIARLTDRAYLTAPPRKRRHKWRDNVVRTYLEDTTRETQDVPIGWGHIRLRKTISQTDHSWAADLFGDAHILVDSEAK